MGLFDWLFGKKEKATAPAPPGPAPPVAANRSAAPALSPEEDNLRRWRESGEALAWVEARQGRWDHKDWLALLESLRRSRFWPLDPDAVGLALEEVKRDWDRARR